MSIAIILLGFVEKRPTKIFLAGDSTISNKAVLAYPETGWGMPFQYFWDSTVTLVNKARNGRSTRTFISEGIWQEIVNEMQTGDYVLIQFGHNDESKEKTDRYTDPESFKNNLRRFVQDCKTANVQPVLLTPVSRRKFDLKGVAQETHAVYSQLVKEVAAATQVPIIDLDLLSRNLYQQWGPEYSKNLFLQLAPGEHPHYPEGKEDNTHFNELGARLIAQLVLRELLIIQPALNDRLFRSSKR